MENFGPEGQIQLAIDGGVAQVVINRPKVLNALSRQTLGLLEEVLDRLEEDDDVRAVVLTGTGEKAFVAGADITEIQELDRQAGEAFSRRGQELFDRIETFPKVVIAAVNGFALGGGCELAMACDIRVAAENARFGQPEINLGILPGYGGTQRLPRRVGQGPALELLLTGDMIDAGRAKDLGLVERVVPEGSAQKEATDLARAVAGKAPLAVAAIKRAVAASCSEGSEGFEAEAGEFGRIMESEDKDEGVSAFLEKRSATWKGR
ncbi:MAG: enoyl-CoA hydratase-related protein [bacterium]